MLTFQGKPDYAASSDPAANTEASITMTARMVILGMHLTIAQGATQTPLVTIEIVNPSGTVVGSYAGSSAAQSASTTSTYDWYEGAALTAGAGATANRAPIPRGLCVGPGWIVRTSTNGKGANTDLSALTVHGIGI